MGGACALGCCGACVAGCCASSVCAVCCPCTTRKKSASISVRLNYAALLAVSSLFSMMMTFSWTQKRMHSAFDSIWFDVVSLNTTSLKTTVSDELVGALGIHRVMTAMVVFHLLLALTLVGVSSAKDTRAVIHNGIWVFKYVLWGCLLAGMFFVPSDVFPPLASIYKLAGALFLLWQCLLFIAFVERFRANIGDSNVWAVVAVTLTLLCFAWSVFVVVVAIAVASGGCGEVALWAVVTMLLALGASFLSITPFVRGAENGGGRSSGIFQASCVSAYAMYLSMMSMLSHPQPDCRPLNSSSSSDDLEPAEAAPAWIRVASCVFTIFALLYTITDTATKNRKTGVEADIDAEYSYTGFHCTFAFGIAQLVMVLTGWDTMEQNDTGTKEDFTLSRSMEAVWIGRVSAFASVLLYAATLLLPPLCPHREFPGAVSEETRARP